VWVLSKKGSVKSEVSRREWVCKWEWDERRGVVWLSSDSVDNTVDGRSEDDVEAESGDKDDEREETDDEFHDGLPSLEGNMLELRTNEVDDWDECSNGAKDVRRDVLSCCCGAISHRESGLWVIVATGVKNGNRDIFVWEERNVFDE